MIINLILLLLFGLGFFLSRKEVLSENLSKEKPKILNFFYKLGGFLYKTEKRFLNRKERIIEGKLKDSLAFLSPGKNMKKEMKRYYIKKTGVFLLIVFLFNIISFVWNIQLLVSRGEEGLSALDRPSQGMASYKLTVTIEDLIEKSNITVQVGETWMEEGEVREAFKAAYEYLKDVILGENPSFEEVSSNLYFPESISGTDIAVVWESENYRYIDSFGRISKANIEEEITTYVKAILSYKEYKEEYEFHIRLVPEKLDTSSKVLKNLNTLLIEEEQRQKEDNKLILPKEIEGRKVGFETVEEESSQSILLFGFLVAILIFILYDTKLSEETQRKNKVLLATYPEIVEKLTLLISAGMTIGRGWERIVLDYKKKGIHNYAYEEMEVTYYEIQRGLSEGKAYGGFGKRCRLHPYIKLGSLLEQNLKKGNRSLEHLLREEVREALEDRKNKAKQLGEEASAKLLMPMFLMLVIVLTICMAPAFIGF